MITELRTFDPLVIASQQATLLSTPLPFPIPASERTFGVPKCIERLLYK